MSERRTSKKPMFVGKDWCTGTSGFEFMLEPPPDIDSDKYLKDPNEWIRLLCIFQRTKQGLFNDLYLLPDLVKQSDDFFVREAGIRILGAASTGPLLMSITDFYYHDDIDTRFAAYSAGASSGSLLFVEPMLKALRIKKGMEREIISDDLSLLLEPEPGIICEPKGDLDKYERTVLDIVNKILSNATWEDTIMFGKLVSISDLVDTIISLVGKEDYLDYNGIVSNYLLVLESYMGISIVGFVDDDLNLNQIAILKILDGFRKSGRLSKYKKGKKYFFGIPL